MSTQPSALPESILPLLERMSQLGASDLHLKVGVPPTYRIAGKLRRTNLSAIPVNSGLIERLLDPIIPPSRKQVYEERGALDFAYTLANGDRFRINVLRSCEQMHAAIRRVKGDIPNFEQLHLPPIYQKLAEETHEGLIIVCGVTGCGKSSTLAAMLEHINQTEALNIITVEDPIEYLFHARQSIVSQREIGLDVEDFTLALRSAVRQDPDVILIGEMRDRETMLAALQAAETGHLVLCTLHTADTMQALGRILEFFPTEQHDFIRGSLANSLKAILAQRLLPAVDEKVARVPACEVLVGEPLVREKIRMGEDNDLPEMIVSGRESGMRNFTQSLAELVESGMVYTDVAMEHAPNREALKSQLQGIKTAAQTLVHRIKRGGGAG